MLMGEIAKQKENYWHYEQCPSGTKPCPSCGKNLVTEFDNFVMISNPPQQRWGWWCGGCGYRELGGIHVHESAKERRMRAWRAAQDQP